ncbi:50S ribosome-binding GTPase [Candidatus Bipolaricaulota bacterium]|nr:50S ribosome-binding GTPase [Candidatus Bipolaricaulota bacterium]
MTILLMGHPNVGKSAVFNRLTGANITESNYPGTTVDFTEGYARLNGEEVKVIDVPGTFSTEPKDEAEKVAMEILEEHKDATVIAVLDSTKVERGLYLAFEILEKNYPLVIALNMWDDAEKGNISIDVEKIEEVLGVPVVPTVAISGKGISDLVDQIPEAEAVDVNKLEERIEGL